jgi:hypothetical protein
MYEMSKVSGIQLRREHEAIAFVNNTSILVLRAQKLFLYGLTMSLSLT